MKFFLNFEGPVQKKLSMLSDFAILNLLCLLCSVPLVTAGASIAALNYTTIRMVEGKSTYVTKEFFSAFKINFRQATIAWLMVVAVLVQLLHCQ